MITKKRAVNKLRGLKINEISHVGSGASLFAEVLITKTGDEDVTATWQDFTEWISKADLKPEADAHQAFLDFTQEIAKSSPTASALHHDAPPKGRISSDEQIKCPSCNGDTPADSEKCLQCKRKLVGKALPFKPKAKKKKLKPKVTVKPGADSDVAPFKAAPDDDADKAKENPFSEEAEEEDPEAEEEPEEGEEDEEEYEEDPEGEEVEEDEEEEFDPSSVELPADLPADVSQYISSLEALIEHQEEKMREQEQMTLTKAQEKTGQKDEAKVGSDDLAFLQDIAKSLQGADAEIDREALAKAFGKVEDVLKAADQRVAAATTVAKAERDIRLTRDAIEKVKGWQALALDPEKFSLVLKGAKEILPEEIYSEIEKAFDGADEAARLGKEISDASDGAGGLFGEIGKTGDGDATAMNEMATEVAKARTADPDLTQAQAVNKVLTDRPDLYEESLK